MYPGCDPRDNVMIFFCRNTTSHENTVVNHGKYSNTRGRRCDWVSSKISGTHICCILLFSLCRFITCHPFAIHRSIGSEDVFGKRTPWSTEEILPDGTISEMLAMAHGIPINYNSILKYILYFSLQLGSESILYKYTGFLGGDETFAKQVESTRASLTRIKSYCPTQLVAASFRSDSSEVMEDEAPMMQTRAPETQSVA